MSNSGGHHGASFWNSASSSGNFGLKMLNKMGWEHGKGLGKRENGVKEFIRSKSKGDSAGIGSVQKTSDQTFQEATDLYNDMLKRLNASLKDNTTAAQPNTADAGDSSPSGNNYSAMQEFLSRRRLYSKFRKAKDTEQYSETHKKEIFAVKKKEDKVNDMSTGAGSTGSNPNSSGLITVTSKLSMADYFQTKMKERALGHKANGFTEDMQEQFFERMQGLANKSKHGGLGFGSAAAQANGNAPQQQQVEMETNGKAGQSSSDSSSDSESAAAAPGLSENELKKQRKEEKKRRKQEKKEKKQSKKRKLEEIAESMESVNNQDQDNGSSSSKSKKEKKQKKEKSKKKEKQEE